MNKVWIVYYYDYESSCIEKIFSSKESAEEWLKEKKLDALAKDYYDRCEIEEWEVY